MSEVQPLRRLTVFTGARNGNDNGYVQAAQDFANRTVEAGYGIVFGGGNVGLMGVMADTALEAGGEVFGVMPESLLDLEVPHPNLTQLDIVPNMHVRKQRMSELGDAFVAMPGGAGTLEELFEVWTWQQLGIHTKPVAVFNPAGFWDPLLSMIDHMADQGFIRRRFTENLIVEDEPEAVLNALATWQPPASPWRRAAEH